MDTAPLRSVQAGDGFSDHSPDPITVLGGSSGRGSAACRRLPSRSTPPPRWVLDGALRAWRAAAAQVAARPVWRFSRRAPAATPGEGGWGVGPAAPARGRARDAARWTRCGGRQGDRACPAPSKENWCCHGHISDSAVLLKLWSPACPLGLLIPCRARLNNPPNDIVMALSLYSLTRARVFQGTLVMLPAVFDERARRASLWPSRAWLKTTRSACMSTATVW